MRKRTTLTWRGAGTAPRRLSRPAVLLTQAAVAALLGLAALSSPALAVPTNLPDTGLVANGPVYATAGSGSTLYVGGAFTQIGPPTGPGVGLDATTAATQSLPPVSGAAAKVSVVVADGSGGWYIGGSFTHVGAVARSGLAHILSNGSVDSTIPDVNGANNSPYPTVNALLLNGSTLYVGGDFTSVGGVGRTDLAAVNTASGAVSSTWNPQPSASFSFTLTVKALALSGSNLYVGGVFSSIGGAARVNLAGLSADPTGPATATAWNPQAKFANGLTAAGVSALDLSGSTLYVGGSFDTIGANVLTRHNLAALDVSTANASATWNPNVADGTDPADGTVTALALSGGALYVGGDFQTVGASAHAGLVAVAADPTGAGAVYSQWDPNGAVSTAGGQAPSSPAVSALAVAGSTLYVGGNFSVIGSDAAARSDVAALNADAGSSGTGASTGWNPNANAPVLAVAAAGQTVYIGGALTSVGGVTRHNLAAISNGQVTSFDPDAETTSGGAYGGGLPAVRALAVSGTTLYVGGQFDQIGGNQATRTALAAIDATTGNATSWNAPVGGSAQHPPVVYTLLSSGSQLYVGGSFSTIGANSQSISALAVLDAATGDASTTWNPAAGAASGSQPTVSALALSGSTLYAGGSFTSMGGQSRDGLVALNTSDATATSWNPAPSPSGSGSTPVVNALALSGGAVYVGGSFTQMGGQQHRSLAAVDRTSGKALSWSPDPLGTVNALAVSADAELVYVGGSFTAIGPQRPLRINLAAVDAYTGDPTAWNPIATGALGAASIATSGGVDAITVTGTGVTVADGFSTFDLAPASGLASFSDSAPVSTAPPAITDPSAGSSAPTQGDTLNETAASWNTTPSTVTYQWLRCDATGQGCAAIDGETGSSHVASPDDVGSTLRVQETATSGSWTSDPATSAATAVVQTAPPAPVNSSPPTISGVLAAGQALTADPGTWSGTSDTYGYQWLRCDPSGSNCQPIPSATNPTYTLSTTDGGFTIIVAVTATDSSNGHASAPVDSAATDVVPSVPVAVSPPTISGSPQQGQTLTDIHAAWSGSPTSYAYQWLRCSNLTGGCSSIPGATAQTYTLTSADLGYTIEASETATNVSGTGSASASSPTAVVQGVAGSPSSLSPPTISGSAVAGRTLIESHGTWRGLPSSYSYQWWRCTTGTCAVIAGANAQSYTLTSADVGDTIVVTESASNGSGAGAPAVSSPTVAIAPAPTAPPAYTAPPGIAGTAQQGQTLTETPATWINSPTSITYDWQRCNGGSCSVIPNVTGTSYTLTAADVGNKIVVEETASNSFGAGTPADSAPTSFVVAPPTGDVTPPSITGTAQQGQTLTEVNGTWSSTPSGFTYQWQQCDSGGGGCLNIAGATFQTYTAVGGDVGHTLRVLEWATLSGGTAGPAISAPTAAVLPLPPSDVSAPGILGTAQAGQVLTETAGTWSGSPSGFSYQWQQCDFGGGGCTSIAGATGSSYVLAPGDVGHTIRVLEWATNAGGTGGPAQSTATAEVLVPPPSIITAPSFSGTAQQGQTLTESHGSWAGSPTFYAYQWQRCDSALSSCVDIAGATSSTYVLTVDDVGLRVRVEELATNSTGTSSPAPSAATSAVLPLPPSNTASPAVSGADRQGQTLTETHGSWTNGPTGYSIQWLHCDANGANCSAIAGAAGQTYTLKLSDAGFTIEAAETAINPGGSSAPAASLPTGVVVPLSPVDATPPGMTGAAQDGQTLSEVHGSWSNNPTSYIYAWQRCDNAGNSCSTLPASGATYQVQTADVGHTLRVQEWAANAGGTTGPATSGASAVVVPAAPVSSGAPTISGTATDGQTLSESHGTWSNNPTSYAYAWLRCDSGGGSCASIAGATASSYTLGDADVGHTVEVRETAANAGGSGSPATSSASAVVAPPPAPVNGAAPAISGTAQSGQTLAEVNGSWSAPAPSLAYQWLRCDGSGGGCAPIGGATGPTYTLGGADVGHAIRVSETATNPGGSAAATSSPTAAVAQVPAPSNVSPPAISGVAQQGQTLTESHGGWSGTPTAYGYQWLRCGAAGAGCAAIAGATGQTYTLSSADVGATVRVAETASNDGGSSSSAMSPPTGGVAPVPGAGGPGGGSAGGGSGGGSGGSGGGVPALSQTGAARLTLSGRALMLDGGLKVACRPGGAACSVTIVVTTKAAPRKGHKASSTITLGRTTLVVTAGRNQELTLRLSSAAASMLAAKHRLSATLRVSAVAGSLPAVTASRALSLSTPRKKRGKRH